MQSLSRPSKIWHLRRGLLLLLPKMLFSRSTPTCLFVLMWVQVLINSGASRMDKLRLVMLYALRFENDRERIRQLTYRLELDGVEDHLIQCVNYLLRYAGKSRSVITAPVTNLQQFLVGDVGISMGRVRCSLMHERWRKLSKESKTSTHSTLHCSARRCVLSVTMIWLCKTIPMPVKLQSVLSCSISILE